MRIVPLPRHDKARKNARLFSLLGVNAGLLVKAAGGLLLHPKKQLSALRRLSQLDKRTAISDAAFLKERRQWKKKFSALLLTTDSPFHLALAEDFYSASLTPLSLHTEENAEDGPILLAAVKDDLPLMPMFFAHYRKLGVRYFAIVDNGSRDGSRDYLVRQPDTDVFSCEETYNSTKKTAWLCRLIARYGMGRWYLTVDSDELLVYPAMETKPLAACTAALGRAGEQKGRAFLLDLYPEGPLFSDERRMEDLSRDYRFFDADNDDYLLHRETMFLTGGMRKRLFGIENLALTKVPLLNANGLRFPTNSHHVFPQREDFTGDFCFALLHYKFLPGDAKKFREIVQRGNYANGSSAYKYYLSAYERDPLLSACGPLSAEWAGPASLAALPFVRDLFSDTEPNGRTDE